MSDDIVLYGKPGCTETKALKKLLHVNGIDFRYEEIDSEDAIPEELKEKIILKDKDDSYRFPTLKTNDRLHVVPGRALLKRTLNLKKEPGDDFYDLVIVGGGLSGLLAAQNCAARGIQNIVLERTDVGGMARNIRRFEHPSYIMGRSLSGNEITEKIQENLLRYGSKILLASNVRSIQKENKVFILKTEHKTYESLCVISAIGGAKTDIDIKNTDSFAGTSVIYNPPLSPARWKGKNVAVIGNNKRAFYFANSISNSSKTVYVLIPGYPDKNDMMYRDLLLSNRAIVHYECSSVVLNGTREVESLKLGLKNDSDTINIQINTVCIFPESASPSGFLKKLIETNPDGTISTDEYFSVPGVEGLFAIGECRKRDYRDQYDFAADALLVTKSVSNYLNKI